MIKYELKGAFILKDGHAMFLEDVVKELNRKAHLEAVIENEKGCPLYVDYRKSCQALKDNELSRNGIDPHSHQGKK